MLEERAAVQLDGRSPVFGLRRVLQLARVGSHGTFHQFHLAAAGVHALLAKLPLQYVERLGERMPTALGLAIGPEEIEQVLAGDRTFQGQIDQ